MIEEAMSDEFETVKSGVVFLRNAGNWWGHSLSAFLTHILYRLVQQMITEKYVSKWVWMKLTPVVL